MSLTPWVLGLAGLAGAAAPTSEQAEIERLRTLVSRLERALADSNLRFRNLQQKLDGSRSPAS